MNSQTAKTWFTSIGIIVAGVVIYYMFFNKPPEPESLLISNQNTQLDGSVALSLLNQIRALKIDTTFFNSPAYISLRDYTVAIPDLPVGTRPNPFAPIPGVRLSTDTGK